MNEEKKNDMNVKFCPVCGEKAHKNKRLAQLIYSCSNCLSNFLVIITTGPKNERKNIHNNDASVR